MNDKKNVSVPPKGVGLRKVMSRMPGRRREDKKERRGHLRSQLSMIPKFWYGHFRGVYSCVLS